MIDRKEVSLSTYLQRISDAISKEEPFPVWITCEIADIKMKPSYAFLDLQEVDAKGAKIATTQAAVWSQAFHQVFSYFQRVTGQPLQRGMKVLIQVEPSFSLQWGFRLLITKIDPTWTLGDAEKTKEEIRKKLKEEGLWDKNKILPPIQDFLNIAVICPDKSAGEGDFFIEANKLVQYGLCKFTTYTSSFEGNNVLSQLVGALWKIKNDYANGIFYDAVCIIRGGGATTGFTWLNQYEIIKAVAECPIPVLSGIGHERDTTLIDEVAFLSFGTPSKVIGAILSLIVQNAMQAENAWQEVNHLINSSLAQAENNLESLMKDTYSFSENLLKNAQEKIENLLKESIGLGPHSILQRGYSILKDQHGKVVQDLTILEKEQVLQVQNKQGMINVIFQGIIEKPLSLSITDENNLKKDKEIKHGDYKEVKVKSKRKGKY